MDRKNLKFEWVNNNNFDTKCQKKQEWNVLFLWMEFINVKKAAIFFMKKKENAHNYT